MTTDKPLVFISCGQFTQDEKALGQSIRRLVDDSTVFQGYFADTQSSLEGVTGNIFARLNKCFGLICVMHHRGKVSSLSGSDTERASVWIEQEIAIAAFMTQVLSRDIKTRVYVKKGISREGIRDKVMINPKDFEADSEVLADIPIILHEWTQLFALERQSLSDSLIVLLDELHYNRDVLQLDLNNFQPVFDEKYFELRRTGILRRLDEDTNSILKQAHFDTANYSSTLRRVEGIQLYGVRANEISQSLSPAKLKAAKSVQNAIQRLEILINEAKQ